jgi:outer membrane protein assembly factor BamE (lipoprotein component of BamABCDE complex)
MIPISALILSAAGCVVSSTGTPVNQDTFDSLQPGKTTYAEVISSLGQPSSTTTATDGTRSATYAYSEQYKSPTALIPVVGPYVGSSVSVDRTLILDFDKHEILEKKRLGASEAAVGQGIK